MGEFEYLPPLPNKLVAGGVLLEGCYEVTFGGQAVGKVQVTREGLYWHFLCHCCLSGGVVCRLQVVCGGKAESLGVLVPSGEGFRLETKLAAKRLGQGELCFEVVPNRPVLQGKFVPIRPEEPFAYLTRLKDAYLARQEGQLGVVIRQQAGS